MSEDIDKNYNKATFFEMLCAIYKALFLIDQSACYKFNSVKTHCGTGANC